MMNTGNVKQVLNILTHNVGQSFASRPNVVRVLASDLKYTPQLEGDVFVGAARRVTETFIKADKKLFSWAKPKPKFSMTEVNPESLVLVHRTKYFPEGGKILSTNMATRNKDGIGDCRHTIHFALNKSVTEHSLGNHWNDMEYSIILPFKKTIESMPSKKIIGGIQDDFFFLDEVKLPKGSVIVKYNPNIENEVYKVSEIFDGVRLIETSSNDMVKTTDNIIKKMGVSTFNEAFQKHLKLNDEEFLKLTAVPEAQLQVYIRNGIENIITAFKSAIEEHKKNIINCDEAIEKWSEQLEICNILNKVKDKMYDFPKAWETFCKKYNYINKLHMETPWYTLEETILYLKTFIECGEKELMQENKDFLVKNLQDAKGSIPKDKSFDIDAMIQIIKESDTPQTIMERFTREFKL